MDNIELIVRTRTILEEKLNNGNDHDEKQFKKAAWFDQKTQALRLLMKEVVTKLTNPNLQQPEEKKQITKQVTNLHKYIDKFAAKTK